MNRFQLAAIDTQTLLVMREDIKAELLLRRREHNVKARRAFVSSLRPKEPESHDEIVARNSSGCLRPPSFKRDDAGGVDSLARYLPALLAQDWSSVYKSDGDAGEFYVYVHVDPRLHCFVAPKGCLGGNLGGMPFYVGKGVGPRAWDLKRNQAHGKRIATLKGEGYTQDDIVRIFADGLSESAALCLESKLIFFFRTQYQEPPGVLVNLDIPATPECDGVMTRYPTKAHWMKSWSKEVGSANA